jgi:hypothetical protein
MKALSPTEVLASTYEGLAPVPMDLARRVRVEQLRRRREAGQRARAVQKRMLLARGQGSAEGSEPA